MPHAIANTTTVLIIVAGFELTPSISTFARIEVSAAKIADRNAKTACIMLPIYAFSILNLFRNGSFRTGLISINECSTATAIRLHIF